MKLSTTKNDTNVWEFEPFNSWGSLLYSTFYILHYSCRHSSTPSPSLFTKLCFMGTPELHNETLISHPSGNLSALHPSILTRGVSRRWTVVVDEREKKSLFPPNVITSGPTGVLALCNQPLPSQPDKPEKIEEHQTLPLRFPLPLISTHPSNETGKPRFKVGIEAVGIERR